MAVVATHGTVQRGTRAVVLVLLLLCAVACRVGGDDSVGEEPVAPTTTGNTVRALPERHMETSA